jgi:hypothetical protein
MDDKLWKWCDKFLVTLWGLLWLLIITGVSIGLAVLVVKWILNLVGVL